MERLGKYEYHILRYSEIRFRKGRVLSNIFVVLKYPSCCLRKRPHDKRKKLAAAAVDAAAGWRFSIVVGGGDFTIVVIGGGGVLLTAFVVDVLINLLCL